MKVNGTGWTRSTALWLVAATILLVAALWIGYNYEQPQGEFLVKPYLQLGDRPTPLQQEALTLMWHSPDSESGWAVQLRQSETDSWRPAESIGYVRVEAAPLRPHRIYSATLGGLLPGERFQYRVLKNGSPALTATARARKAPGQPFRAVLFGDLANGSDASRMVAHRAYLQQPDIVLLPGDIVYQVATLSEYRRKFFPVYNADRASSNLGAPLLQSTLFVAAPGNHDINTAGNLQGRNLDLFPDGLAYFLNWSQPLNGPLTRAGAANTPKLLGIDRGNQSRFLKAAGPHYPTMANFSFDYGSAHWLILDANEYVDWSDRSLRSWVTADLSGAQSAAWRFVVFHQAPFSSDQGRYVSADRVNLYKFDRDHFIEQRMRQLCDLFEEGAVDVVFSGHVHNYQRSHPLRYAPARQKNGRWLSDRGEVAGTLTLDGEFDGKTRTRPDGVIYIVTGAGGAALTGTMDQRDRPGWQPYTDVFVANKHSLTVLDVEDKSLTVNQVADDGTNIDSFKISR